MRNVAGGDWAPWYAEHRLAPYLRTARDTGDLTGDEAAVIERVCERLPALAGPDGAAGPAARRPVVGQRAVVVRTGRG